jgi:hypothetical protein
VSEDIAAGLRHPAPVSDFSEIPKTHLFSPSEAAMRELWARRFVTEITGVARGLGYGMFHGGSLIRDIDLVAVPWRGGGKFLPDVEFVLELCHCLPLHMGNHGETLFGHRWYALWHDAHRDHQIDLKVMLPADKIKD